MVDDLIEVRSAMIQRPMPRAMLLGFGMAVLHATACRPGEGPNRDVVAVFGGLGLGDGHFSYPRAIDVAPDGAVFVVDKAGRVQRFNSEGRFDTGWHMPEYAAGKPVGLKVHPDGRLFVADTHYHRVVVFDRDGNELARFGEEGNTLGQFQLPTDVAFDRDGFIYVSEYYGNDRVTKWTSDLQCVAAIGDEPIEGKRLSRPTGLVVDAESTLWVADACNHRVIRFSLDGTVLSTFGGYGTEPGRLRYPYDLSLSPDGAILVCEFEGQRLQWFTPQGRSLRVWGSPGRNVGELFAPWGAVYGPNGLVYVCDSMNERVQVVRP